MKAIVSITLDNEFVVHDIKVIEGEGMFIAMPSRKAADGEYRDRTPGKRDKIPQSIILAESSKTTLLKPTRKIYRPACIRRL